MDLSIVIPRSTRDFFTRVSTYHSPYSPCRHNMKAFPSVPKTEYSDYSIVGYKKLFDWGHYNNEDDIKDQFDKAEKNLIAFDNTFYKPYFVNNTRILIKKEIDNNLIKLHLLVKDMNTWLRTHVYLKPNESCSKYYDYKYKNLF